MPPDLTRKQAYESLLFASQNIDLTQEVFMAAKKKTTATKKRGPGRPKGSKNKPKQEEVPAKRGPGRPKGSTTKKTAAKKTAGKRGPGRPPGSKNKTTAKKTTTKKSGKVTEVKRPAKKRQPVEREFSEVTGFIEGTDQDTIALALLEGGESRADITESLKKTLPKKTRTGTEKPVQNMVSGVLNKLLDRGYTVEQSFKVVPPTTASKRKAARNRKK
jgi:hypothetical protein